VREVYDERFDSADRRLRDADTRYQQRFEERDIRFQEEFKGVDLQFKERDIRIEQTSAARDAALAAALQAAKEAVNEQATAAARATEKAEESFKTILNGLRDIYNERFTSIHLQFTERDVRTEQAATASASALAAALQAAKEAVFEQAQAAAKAAEKTELSFTKQIDQIGLQIKTVSDGFGERISELKERIDRGEGSESGSKSHATETRLNVGAVVAGVSMLIALAAVLFAIFK
jgi:membrane protein involved in colicin uptake